MVVNTLADSLADHRRAVAHGEAAFEQWRAVWERREFELTRRWKSLDSRLCRTSTRPALSLVTAD